MTNTGLIGRAKEAKEETQNAEKNQQSILEEYEKVLNENAAEKLTSAMYNTKLSDDNNTTLKDANGNTFVIPAGFKMVVNDDTNNATTVDKGIVIEDATVDSEGKATATAGSQFVWIPVGKIYTDTAKTEANAKTIELSRYTFDSNGTPTAQGEKAITENNINYQELETSNKGNIVAKNITNFKTSVTTNGGYYIGRYEARTSTARNKENDTLTQITVKGTDKVYNWVTQIQAASQSQNMYNSTKFTSDLMNSYAWDTATLFLQTCGTNNKYSKKSTVNTTLSQTGTNTQSTKDVQCNIFDMASNVWELTTETSNNFDNSCVRRGGSYGYSSDCTKSRYYYRNSTNNDFIGFRPILYVNV